MSEPYLSRMKTLVFEAGKTALQFLNDSHPSLKGDRSVVTLADKAISSFAHDRLADFLARPGHILIDEEDARIGEYLHRAFQERTPYIWAMDPIDGTRLYANRIPYFGISLGLIKELKPWLGCVYFPVLRELFYSDGDHAYFVQNAFTAQEKQSPIRPVDQTISHQTILFASDSFFRKFQWDYQDCRLMIQSCAVVDLCWPSIGRGCGAVMRPALWDFAGGWPILKAAGLAMRSLRTGEVLAALQEDLFENAPVPWKLKEHYLVSSERNFPILRAKLGN